MRVNICWELELYVQHCAKHLTCPSFFFFFSWLTLAVLGLPCFMQASLVVVHGLSCPQAYGFLVPRPGIECMSPALEGRFSTTRPPEKYLVLPLLILTTALGMGLCGSQKTVENSSRYRNTRPPYLPPEKSICRSRSNSQNQTWNNELVPNWERSTSTLYIVPVMRVYVPRFFVSSQQRFGATKTLGASQLSGLGQTVLQLLGKSVLQLYFIQKIAGESILEV